jgi:DNA-directed RNA polymerase specialized sigma24 family protein
MQTAVDDLLNSVDSVLRNVVRQKLRVTLRTNDFREQNLDALDVLQDIRLKLIRKLSPEAGEGNESSIQEFTAYAATVAYRTCSDYLRARYPLRTSLKNSLRRILDKADEFAAWEGASGEWMCGYPGWKNPSFKTDAAKVMELRTDPYRLPHEAIPRVSADSMNGTAWKALLEGVFQYVGGPLALDDLIAIVAPVVGMEDVPDLDDSEDNEEDSNDLSFLTSRDPGPYSNWLTRERLKIYWAAVLRLLVWHRCAYLLNIRDGDLEALPFYGVASFEEIGDSLEFGEGHFLRLSKELGSNGPASPPGSCGRRFLCFWNYLPFEDNVIAVVLEVTRAQVIGYRNKAKDRLKRMLKGEL